MFISLIENKKIKENDIISEKICDEFDKLSINEYGCYIIETLLKHSNDKYYNIIYEKTCNNFDKLIQDEYGNHIISFFLENKKVNNNDIFYQNLKGKVFNFSTHKYAVYTLEKAIEKGSEIQRKSIIDEILNSDKKINNEDYLIYLSKHNFGNFAVQHFLEYSDETTRINLIKKIYPLLNNKSKGFGKHIIKKIIELNIAKKGAYDDIINGK